MSPIYATLLQIADNDRNLLTHWQTDLTVHDQESLAIATAGSRYIWCIRQFGTTLFPMDVSHDPGWLTFHLRDPKARFFVIEVVESGPSPMGHVTEIAPQEALRLAEARGHAGPYAPLNT